MATKPQKPVAMCCVTIGYRDFLLPADKGLRLVELMKDAIECEQGYDGSRTYFVKQEQPEIGMTIVRASQMRGAPPPRPTLLLDSN
jgi:hypothetical protein